MAPRRTAVKTAQSSAAQFDFDAFLADFRQPEFTANLVRRSDLAPELASRQRVLDELDESIERMERAEGDDPERDITETSPLDKLLARRNALTIEYNDLADEYNNSAVQFTFRVPDKMDDKAKISGLMVSAGFVEPTKPDTEGMDELEGQKLEAMYEVELDAWWTAMAIRSMSVTCIKHPGTAMGAPPLTVKQWEQLLDRVGQASFSTLTTAWFEAVQAAAPSVPFSQRPLHTPETDLL